MPKQTRENKIAEIDREAYKVIAEYLGIDPREVKPYALLERDLGASPLNVVELLVIFEERFEVQVSNEEVEGIEYVKELIDYVKSKTE